MNVRRPEVAREVSPTAPKLRSFATRTSASSQLELKTQRLWINRVRPLLPPMLARAVVATSFWPSSFVMVFPPVVNGDFDTMFAMPCTPFQRPIALLTEDSVVLPTGMLNVFCTIWKGSSQVTGLPLHTKTLKASACD